MIRHLLAAALLALASCSPARDGEADIHIGDAWARETAPGQVTAAIYLTISNRGAGGDRLISITSPAAANALLHETIRDGAISRMRLVEDGIPVSGGETVRLEPGGSHVMLEGLARPLKRGESIDLQLKFEHSGNRNIEVQIADPTAQGASRGN